MSRDTVRSVAAAAHADAGRDFSRESGRESVREVRRAAGAPARARRLDPVSEPRAVRWLLTGAALAFLALFLVVPLAAVFFEALRKGVDFYLESLADPDAHVPHAAHAGR